ncbi:MAG: VWA domain-containing protein, partial [Pirellulaceae bacterium]|nr:VWA domain-containing protein [Pirellulaceae bacterium]
PEEQAWSGPELQGSIFGREFRLGLAGLADLPLTRAEPTSTADPASLTAPAPLVATASPANSVSLADPASRTESTKSADASNSATDLPSGGNGDGEVTLLELITYVQRQVNQWSINEHAAPQTPRLLISSQANSPDNARLTWGLKRRELNRQIADARPNQPATISPSSEEMSLLWSQWQQLRKSYAYAHDPKSWSELEQRLLWLEKLSVAGEAYAEQATQQVYPQLKKRLGELTARLQTTASSENLFARSQLFAGDSEISVSDVELPSLAWQEFIGVTDATSAQTLRGQLLSVVDANDPNALDALKASAVATARHAVWNELNFVQLLSKYQRFEIWPDRTKVRQALELRDRCEKLAVFGDPRNHRWRRAHLEQIDILRRRMEDQLFIGPSDQVTANWTALQQLVQQAEQDRAVADSVANSATDSAASDSTIVNVANAETTGNGTPSNGAPNTGAASGEVANKVDVTNNSSSPGANNPPSVVGQLSGLPTFTGQSAIQQAVHLHDRGLTQAASLAAWICSPHNGMENLGEWLDKQSALSDNPLRTGLIENRVVINDPMRRERLAISRLLHWIDGLHQLGDLIAASPEGGLSNLQKLTETCQAVEDDYQQLAALVGDQVQRLLDQKLSERSGLRPLEAILKLPFLDAEVRKTLCDKRQQWLLESVKANATDQPQNLAARLTSLASTFDVRKRSAASGSKPTTTATATSTDNANTPGHRISSESGVRERYIDRVRSWSTHPLSALLQLETDVSLLAAKSESPDLNLVAEGQRSVFDRANAVLRAHYASMATFDGRQLNEWLPRADTRVTLADDASAWMREALAAHMERAHLPVCPVTPERSNSTGFRTQAFKDQMYWYARRTLADLYGSPTNPAELSLTQPEFFEKAALSMLAFASTLPDISAEQEAESEEIRRRLAILGPLSRHGWKASVKRDAPVMGSTLTPLELSLRTTLPGAMSSDADSTNFPAGTGVGLIRNIRGVIPGAACTVPFPITSENSAWTIQAPALDRALPHEAVVVFRGHEFRVPLFVGQGVVVDFQPARYDWAEIVLFGDRQRQPSIMFILDCSWSMGEQIPIEAIDSRTQSRLELAKVQLVQLIRQIASRPDARLGVRLFGHRLGWSRNVDPKTGAAVGGTQVLPQPEYRGSIPEDLAPSRDVEAVVPLGRFESTMIAGLESTLSGIKPWGQSPLYLSIIEAFKDFSSDSSDTAKSIVVITDGDNFQFNSGRLASTLSGPMVTKADVLRAWEGSQVPLFVLGVGIEKDQTNDATKSLKELAEKSGGKYYDISTGSDLLRALSEQLSTAEYSVSSASSGKTNGAPELNMTEAGKQTARLNTPVTIKGLSSPSNEYSVEFQTISNSLSVEGGESLELFVQADKQEFVAKPFDRDSPRSAVLSRPGQNQRLIFRAHRPVEQTDGFLFPISFQDPDSHFTRRPKETWLEVIPVVDSTSGSAATSLGGGNRTYWFYDTAYEPRKPVPYQQWLASDWPANATMADIRVWAAYEKTPALATISLKQLSDRGSDYAIGHTLEGVPGVTLRASVLEGRGESVPWQLQVTELHDESSRGVGSISIHVENDSDELPVRIVRRFDSPSRMAVHTFSFEPSTGMSLARSNDARLVIRSRQNVQAGALQIPGEQSLRVELTQAQELLPLEATLSR